MDKYSVYIHTNRKNGKKYVGITSRPLKKRWKGGSGYFRNKYFWPAIKKYGWEGFDHEVVAEGLTFHEAAQLEIELIAKYQTNNREYGYNLSTGGEFSAAGHHCQMSEETKRKQSEAKKGKFKTPETRQRMSEAQKARPTHYRPSGKESGTARLIYQKTKAGELVASYYGRGEAARALGLASPSKIGEVCLGKRKSAYGFLWEYAKE